ncbi:MAG: YitT family protein [Pyrinomonadaceae bacterium]|nr:YitT family protein [Pyrinomonadaceae bacterium]
MKPIVRESVNALFILLGILSAALGLKGFLLSSRFIDGGVTGVSMLVSDLSGVPLSILILLINLPFLVIGYKQMSKTFALKSFVAIVGLAVCLALVKFPNVTEDKLLTAVFGGFFIGAGIGLAIRGGGVLDGTEVAALLLSKKLGTQVGDIILVLNVAIFSVAALFLGVEPALYSMLTYFAASKTIDFIIHGIEEYNGIIIVSAQSEAIRSALLNDIGRGVTIYKGRGGFTEAKQDILYCVVTRLEIARVKRIVEELDEAAFIVIHAIADASGGVMKRHAVH